MKTKQLLLILTVCSAIFLANSCSDNNILIDKSYEPNCSSCHGEDLQGLAIGPSLLVENLKYGNTTDSIIKAITKGFPDKGMPGFENTLSATEIQSLAIWIGEQRAETSYDDFKFDHPLEINDIPIKSEQHNFKLEVIAKDLGRWPYSIEPMPDGSFLYSEKIKGLRIISSDGKKSDLIEGLPTFYDDVATEAVGLVHGTGWLLDIKKHPNYEQNGWIYFTYGDRCVNCNSESNAYKHPVSMLKVMRIKLNDGELITKEIIWEQDIEYYTGSPETTTGGRLTFDNLGHLYFSVGAKKYTNSPPGNLESYLGIQDLSQPYGKIYRINDDGSIPQDNPYYQNDTAIKSIWTYGHRSPQGLEYHIPTQKLWSTEMGPRGGDEINLLEQGKNYGWPLYSKGLNYDGTPVEYGKYLDIEWNMEDIEQPKVDLTPSPAISSFIVYDDDKFPNWKNNLIVGSLKATTLYRYVVEDEAITHQEILIKDLARIRDIEIGYDGLIYLLLEHKKGSQLVRLVPTSSK